MAHRLLTSSLVSTSGVLHKYPNPHAEHVVSMDVIDQTFDAESGLLRLERIIGVKQGAPGWAVRVSIDENLSRSFFHYDLSDLL